jgi:SAM-dependent methyltransferase
MSAPPGSDWAAYYRSTIGREPRPLFAKGMAAVEAAGLAPGQAIEIGFGDGRETLALLETGWRVLAIDPAPAAAEVLQSQVPAHVVDRLEIRSVPAEGADLPPFDLLYAGYSLPFLGADALDRLWNAARDRLRPGGILVVNFFGPRDSWAGREGMRFTDVDDVRRLVDGLELLALDEEDGTGTPGDTGMSSTSSPNDRKGRLDGAKDRTCLVELTALVWCRLVPDDRNSGRERPKRPVKVWPCQIVMSS